jgi:hypothetical protein
MGLDFNVGNYLCKTKNDGGLTIATKGSHSGSLRIGRIPIVGFEVRNKLLHLWYPDILTILQAKSRNSRLNHESGEDQPVTPEIYAQICAQMFATAFNQRQMGFQSATLDQQAFHVHFQGTTIAIMSADYSDEYIQDIKNPGRPQEGRKTYVRRTKSLKLDEVEDRIIALKWIFGLGKYLASGQARIATLQASRAIAAGQI